MDGSKSTHKNSTGHCSAPGILSLIFVLSACLFMFCGCAGTDKYIEIIVAGGDAVITPVPAANKQADSTANMVSAPSAVPEENIKETEEDKTEYITEAAVQTQPDVVDVAIMPPVEIPVFTPLIIPTPELLYTPVPIVTPVASAAPAVTPVPTPDTDKIMQQELADVYAEYSEEWDLLYKEYETKCAITLSSIENMGPESDDPEYVAEYTRLSGLLDKYEKEFKQKVEKLDAVYYEKYSAVYDKYGK